MKKQPVRNNIGGIRYWKQKQSLDTCKNIGEAFAILKFTPKVGADVVEKVMRSAIANAEHNFDMNVDNLYVSEIFVDQGPTMKRIHPRSRGQAFKILKRSSHVTVVVSERA